MKNAQADRFALTVAAEGALWRAARERRAEMEPLPFQGSNGFTAADKRAADRDAARHQNRLAALATAFLKAHG